ncbi:hypothetical protein [Modestobacter marinus]|uniref:hypothetical protein n=1 Tax=Modestobacter marinus TaxID=477641 RepID=UPI001C946C85|nr:hypothetical protein [Modestobacter marinus]
MTGPDDLDTRLTLRTAVARFEELRTREALATDPDDDTPVAGLTREETLELLALGEVIARKASYGRQLTVRTARAAGASWTAIGRALGTSKQSAWETHARWIDDQADQHRTDGVSGLDELAVARSRRLAGRPDDHPE